MRKKKRRGKRRWQHSQSLSQSLGSEKNPAHRKFGLEVRTGDPTQASRECGKVCCSHNEALLGERGRLLQMCLTVAREPAGVGFTAVTGGPGISRAGFGAYVDWDPTGTKGWTTWAVGSACLGSEQTGSWVVMSESCLQWNIRNGVKRCITLSHCWHRWRGPLRHCMDPVVFLSVEHFSK